MGGFLLLQHAKTIGISAHHTLSVFFRIVSFNFSPRTVDLFQLVRIWSAQGKCGPFEPKSDALYACLGHDL